MKERTGGATAPELQSRRDGHFGDTLNQMLAAWKNTAAPVVFAAPVTETPRSAAAIEAELEAMAHTTVMPVTAATAATVEEAVVIIPAERPQAAKASTARHAAGSSIARRVLDVFVGVSVDHNAEPGFSVVFSGASAERSPSASTPKPEANSEARPATTPAVAPAPAVLQTVTG